MRLIEQEQVEALDKWPRNKWSGTAGRQIGTENMPAFLDIVELSDFLEV